ncbi:hypothetical protein KJ673_03675 [Patescibacteria group bacterium]|nr:hypothetical protein [Patescibacteria group bacterium]MBU4452676.1 hypothetical protein [Patescibacteria group bacterium]MCG2687493.1 DUF5698 domain-containing protein [Candidatus Parcubacteria bacterium]
MSLFFIGIVEMIIISMWTRFVSESKIIASGLTSVVNIFIWYYVLQSVLGDIENVNLVALYALGCAVGTMMTTAYFRFSNKNPQTELSCEN